MALALAFGALESHAQPLAPAPLTTQNATTATDGILLDLPLNCDMTGRCGVQFHVDRLPGPEVGDFRCGRRSYDGHRGTDFRVFSPDDFNAGVPVLAAAAGRVVATHDGMEDVDVSELGRENVEGRAGGNQVVIAHEGGWVTYYWHLRKGSVAVREGQSVAAGTRLGLVGLSGDTNFPHLHFELRLGRDTVVDPFDPGSLATDCSASPKAFWSAPALAQLAYEPVVARMGFATRSLSRAEAIYGRAPEARPDRHPAALFAWLEVYGLASGDRVSLQWRLPDGTWRKPASLVWRDVLPYAFRTARLNVPAPLPSGTYLIRLRVQRGAAASAILDATYSVSVD